MALKVQKVDTWAASLADTPGSLAAKLKALSKAGVNLDFVLARRAPDKPGSGVVFVTPIKSAAGRRAAQAAGFRRTARLHTLRLQGPNRRGQGAAFLQALAAKGLNLRGVSAAGLGPKFIAYIALDTQPAAAKAVRVLRSL